MRLVVRIGGSVVAAPLKPDLMSRYVRLLRDLQARGHEVAAVVGGGSLSRELIQAAKGMGLSERFQDEVAISVSRVLAQLFVLGLGRSGSGVVSTTIEGAGRFFEKGKIVVMGGLRPGMTTDTVAALIAERVSADLLIKATDQDGIFDRDPRKFPSAHKLDSLSFDDLSRLFESGKHKAGIHQVIDPEAVRVLRRMRLRTVVVNGADPENVLRAVSGERVGTVIG